MYKKSAVQHDGISMIIDSKPLFDGQRWTSGDMDDVSLSTFFSTVDADGHKQVSAFYAPDLTADVVAASFQSDAPDGSAAPNGANEDGSGPVLAAHPGSLSIVDHVEALNIEVSRSSLVDELEHQLASLSTDKTEDALNLGGWTSAASVTNSQSQPLYWSGSPADPTGASSEPHEFGGSAVDAKGTAGGKPGGGGGGGGGSGLLTTYTSGDPSVDNANEFNIKINFSGTWTAKQQAIVTWAADTWSKIITGDIHDDLDLAGNLVDDIVISMSAVRLDGNGNPLFGNVLAQTQDIIVRDEGTLNEWLPLTATIKLDTVDLKNSAFADAWDDIILHEMGHALGFIGAIFDVLGVSDGFNFTGENAMAAYGGVVPLEDGGGSGTVGSHWDEANFAPNGTTMSNDLMTGYIAAGQQTYLSDTTVGAMADLGYIVQDPSVGSYLVIDSHLLIV